MRYLTAENIYLHNKIISQSKKVLVFDGPLLTDITTRDNVPADALTVLDGLLVPGFVNAHGHLELSHMKDIVPRGTHLVPFLIDILKHRAANEDDIVKAATMADKAMYAHGIVAVGDISNKADSFAIKQSSALYYHTFIECLGVNPDRVADYMQPMASVAKAAHILNLQYSLTPHAPYSVSEPLLQAIYKYPSDKKNISLHFQETFAELELFNENKGDFFDFFAFLNLKPYILDRKNKKETEFILTEHTSAAPFMLVHNTFCGADDLRMLKAALGSNLYLCTCPKANIYIENKLPNYALWLELMGDNNHICMGTDSLASNNTLDIYAEVMTIQETYPHILPDTLLQWATLNGASALSVAHRFGSFEVGKTPGAVLLPAPVNNKLVPAQPQRIL